MDSVITNEIIDFGVAPKALIPEVAAPEAPTVTTEDEVVAPGEQKVETTNYQKLSGPKSTGQKIDLTQFNKPKKAKPLAVKKL